MKTYKVIRRHIGDRVYAPGDTREGDGLDHLVPHVLEPIEAKKAKAERAPNNKAEAAAPANKAATGKKAKQA